MQLLKTMVWCDTCFQPLSPPSSSKMEIAEAYRSGLLLRRRHVRAGAFLAQLTCVAAQDHTDSIIFQSSVEDFALFLLAAFLST